LGVAVEVGHRYFSAVHFRGGTPYVANRLSI
jgi:hypothetical protein